MRLIHFLSVLLELVPPTHIQNFSIFSYQVRTRRLIVSAFVFNAFLCPMQHLLVGDNTERKISTHPLPQFQQLEPPQLCHLPPHGKYLYFHTRQPLYTAYFPLFCVKNINFVSRPFLPLLVKSAEFSPGSRVAQIPANHLSQIIPKW